MYSWNYFNPSYITDLRNRLEKGVKTLFAMIVSLNIIL